MTTTTTMICKRCGGTGRVQFSRVDGGRCFACTGQADTSYTRNAPTGEETAAAYRKLLAARRESRRLARSLADAVGRAS